MIVTKTLTGPPPQSLTPSGPPCVGQRAARRSLSQPHPSKHHSSEQSPLLPPGSCLSPSNDRILPQESRSVPESTLLTSGTPAAPSPAELGRPSGLSCDLLPRAPWAPSTAMRCPQRESSGFGCRREVHTCERKEEEDLVLGRVGSEGPPRRDTVSRVAMFRPHGGSRGGAPTYPSI